MQNEPSFSRQKFLLLSAGFPLLLLILLPFLALLGSIHPQAALQSLRDPLSQQALWLSLTTSLASTGLILLFGTPLALLLARPAFTGRGLLEITLQATLITPPAVAGIGLLLAFSPEGTSWLGTLLDGWGLRVPGTPLAVVLAQCLVASPYFILTAAAGFKAVDPELQKVARLEGAGAWQRLRHLWFPVAWPALLGGTAMAWARALGEFAATLLFAGNIPGRTQTLPLSLYSGLGSLEPTLGINRDRIIITAVILLAFSFALLALIRPLTQRKRVS